METIKEKEIKMNESLMSVTSSAKMVKLKNRRVILFKSDEAVLIEFRLLDDNRNVRSKHIMLTHEASDALLELLLNASDQYTESVVYS